MGLLSIWRNWISAADRPHSRAHGAIVETPSGDVQRIRKIARSRSVLRSALEFAIAVAPWAARDFCSSLSRGARAAAETLWRAGGATRIPICLLAPKARRGGL